MLVGEFIEWADNEALASCLASGYYMGLFLAILDEFHDERCSILFGKILANMSEDFRKRAGVQTRDINPADYTMDGR